MRYDNLIFFAIVFAAIGCTKMMDMHEPEDYQQVSLKFLKVGQKSKFSFSSNTSGFVGDTVILEVIALTDSGYIAIDYLSDNSRSIVGETDQNLPHYLSQKDTAISLLKYENGNLSISALDNQSRLIMPFGGPNLNNVDSLQFTTDGCGESILRPSGENISNVSNLEIAGKLNDQIVNEMLYSDCYFFYKKFTGPGPGTQQAVYYIITNGQSNLIRSYFSSIGFSSFDDQCFSLIAN